MATITLRLDERQAEILGYALTKAKRAETVAASERKGDAREGCLGRAGRIEELRDMLDVACGAATLKSRRRAA